MMKDALRGTIVTVALSTWRIALVILLAYLCAVYPLGMIACCLVGILLSIWCVCGKVVL
jgi:hypothetical protein